MIVAQDAAAYYRQVGIGADEIVREYRYKIEQVAESLPVDMHRYVLSVEHYAVLVVIHVRTVLQEKVLSAQLDRYYAVILPCRMIKSAGIPFILRTQEALRITR